MRRERSNTPLQALTMMNDPVFVEATQALAHRVMRESKRDTSARLKHLFRLCMMREPRADEMERLGAFYADQSKRVRASGNDALSVLGIIKDATPSADAQETATLIALARVLMNLDEFINRE